MSASSGRRACGMSRPLPACRSLADHPLEPRVLAGDGSYGVGQVLTQTCRASSETWPAGWLREVEADEGVVLIHQAGRRLWVPEVGSERRHLVVEDIGEPLQEDEGDIVPRRCPYSQSGTPRSQCEVADPSRARHLVTAKADVLRSEVTSAVIAWTVSTALRPKRTQRQPRLPWVADHYPSANPD